MEEVMWMARVIGVPKEIKSNENRVGMTPVGVGAMVEAGHTVLVEKTAGQGSGFSDEAYIETGAEMLATAEEVYERADMIVKVKEPLPPEYDLMRPDQILFTYLHLAAEPELTKALMKNKVKAIAYETIELSDGSLPLLTPMSEVAGRMATQIGAQMLEKHNGGRGVLLGGIPGVLPARVVIIGGGVVGTNSAKIALGMGAQVTILDISADRLRYLDDIFGARIQTLMSNPVNLFEAAREADLLIGAVLLPGAKAPCLITADMVKAMKEGAVIVDVAIDQGGCVETIDRVTTHAEPTYEKHGVVHYSVANMPGAVPRTSTLGLTNVTLPYALRIAEKGVEASCKEDPALAKGVNVYGGHVVYKPVAEAVDVPYKPLSEVMK